MEKRKFFLGLFMITGLILGSLFTNGIYKEYLAYGGRVDALVLSNKDLYVSSSSLFPYILFKRGKQYGILFLAGYLLQPLVLLYGGAFSIAFFLGSVLSLQIIQLGLKGLFLVFFSFFPHYLLYGGTVGLLMRRNILENKKEEILLYEKYSFLDRFSIQLELIFLFFGTVLESYVNPWLMTGIIKMLN